MPRRSAPATGVAHKRKERGYLMEFDYIIVGAGSAGCVLANRLTERDDVTVLLLEAGGRDLHPLIHIPAGFMKTLTNRRVNWCYETEPEEHANGRRIFFPRGKVLGGSSSINGHLYIRGQQQDYDTWAQMGNRGWSYDDVKPYFLKSENREGGAGDQGFHGKGGPLNIADPRERHPISDAFIASAETLGIPRTNDSNGAQHDGAGYFDNAMKNGRRMSSARAFLKPARKRANLHVEVNALAERIDFKDRRAVGVTYRQGDKQRTATARREVLLSGGTVNSPQLLQLSGVGPGAHLRAHGIDVVHDVAGVGENLQDHYMTRLSYRVKNAGSLNERSHGLRLVAEVAKYALFRRGLLAYGAGHVRLSVKSHPEQSIPDLQMGFTPGSYAGGQFGVLDPYPGMSCGVWVHRPDSRGRVTVKSANPQEPPAIALNYLSELSDREATVAGLKLCRQIFHGQPLANIRDIEELPGDQVSSDDEWLEYARANGSTVYHCVGTCKMGTDPMAVVDPTLKVHGIDGLRVVDASIMPRVVSANTNATVYMIAEKAADMIKADQ
ncbi:MAG: GMC family oxidoreductase N-terminal domain-containing protein [Gammaproteobacteria bacterium]|nr:GMC family oxidoreductase N-terminal domain-containing protein [Gammaproteobacteria bacterium]